MSVPVGERRIAIGPLLGLVGALLLAISLFLEWWDGLTAFTVFEALDLVLAAIAIASAVALAEALGGRLPGDAAPGRELALPLGVAAFLIVGSQLLNDPPAVVGTDRGPAVGLWLALGGSLLMLAGGLLSALRISLALDLEPRRREEPEAADAEEETDVVEGPTDAVASPDSADVPAARDAADSPDTPAARRAARRARREAARDARPAPLFGHERQEGAPEPETPERPAGGPRG